MERVFQRWTKLFRTGTESLLAIHFRAALLATLRHKRLAGSHFVHPKLNELDVRRSPM